MARNTQTKAVHGLKVQSEGVDGTQSIPPLPAMRPGAKVAWDKPRPCRYCRLRFQPKQKAAQFAQFCCANHRKRYHETGRMPFYKLFDRVESIVQREVSALAMRVDELERTVREGIL